MKKNNWDKLYLKNSGNKNYWPSEFIVSSLNNIYKYKNKKNLRVLDFGFGWGNNLFLLKKLKFNFVGVENSKVAYNFCKKKYGKRVIYNNSLKIPFSNNYFDCVVDRQSIQHNQPKDIVIVYSEIKRILKKGGIFISEHLTEHSGTSIPFSKFDIKKINKEFGNKKFLVFFKKNQKEIIDKKNNLILNSYILRK